LIEKLLNARGPVERRRCRIDCNTVRAHGRLGGLPAAVFDATRKIEKLLGWGAALDRGFN